MSFAKNVKEEIINLNKTECCKRSEISAILHLSGVINFNNEGKFLEFQSANVDIARRFLRLIKDLYQANASIITKKQVNLNKKSFYIVRIIDNFAHIIEETKFLNFSDEAKSQIIMNDCCKSAYLRGAFLASGSINDPNSKTYHLEIVGLNDSDTVFIQRLMNEYRLNAKIIKRRNNLVIYIKEMNKIIDFLRIIDAQKSAFYFDNITIKKSLNSDIKGIMNCEIANEVKSVKAGLIHLEDINVIENSLIYKTLDEKFKKIIEIRKEYSTASLNQLREELFNQYQITITKSGLNHRFRKLKEMALEIKKIKN